MFKMQQVYQKLRPALSDANGQETLKKVKENAQKLNDLQSEYKKFQDYLLEAEGKLQRHGSNNSMTHSITSNSSIVIQSSSAPGTPLPQHNVYEDMGPDPEPEFIEPEPGTPDHDDDFQTENYPVIGTCRALSEFDAANAVEGGSVAMVENEEMFVLEADQGDGWTRVRKNDQEQSEGFVPTSSIQCHFYDQDADNPIENLNTAFDVAEQHLDIPRMLDPEVDDDYVLDSWDPTPPQPRAIPAQPAMIGRPLPPPPVERTAMATGVPPPPQKAMSAAMFPPPPASFEMGAPLPPLPSPPTAGKRPSSPVAVKKREVMSDLMDRGIGASKQPLIQSSAAMPPPPPPGGALSPPPSLSKAKGAPPPPPPAPPPPPSATATERSLSPFLDMSPLKLRAQQREPPAPQSQNILQVMAVKSEDLESVPPKGLSKKVSWRVEGEGREMRAKRGSSDRKTEREEERKELEDKKVKLRSRREEKALSRSERAIGQTPMPRHIMKELEPLLPDAGEIILKPEAPYMAQVALKTLDEYGIGTRIPSILQGKPSLCVDNLKQLMELQNKAFGSWEMTPDLEKLLGIDFSLCRQLLTGAGINSLGTKVLEQVFLQMSTLIVLFCVLKTVRPELFPMDFSNARAKFAAVFEGLTSLQKLETSQMPQLSLVEPCLVAMTFCGNQDREYPLIYSTLELGHSWEEVVATMLGMHEPQGSLKTLEKTEAWSLWEKHSFSSIQKEMLQTL